MKKAVVFLIFSVASISCNVSVDKQNNTDSVSKTDSFLKKADTTLHKWGDSAKEKMKDAGHEIKKEWKEHFGKDSATKKLQ
jgi:DNA-directed RNA polymerase alpha subunit